MTKSHLKTTSTLLVCLGKENQGLPNLSDVHEFLSLNETLGARALCVFRFPVRKINAKHYVSEGVIDVLNECIQSTGVSQVSFNVDLPARQQSALARTLCVSVVDRTELILRIFELRAHTSVGKLQVELARLSYDLTRLVRGWTHLERQRGGIGLRGGPGETQIEIDRRLLREKIRRVKKQLEKVKKTRSLNMRSRSLSGCLSVSLVGYTNAGKSTLFNQLTASKSLSEDKLFATLDPLSRKMAAASTVPIVLTDTVGFIQQMPDTLVETFHATLIELLDSDLVLHVVDIADEHKHQKQQVVMESIKSIGGENIPQWVVYNKIDQVKDAVTKADKERLCQPFYVSALEPKSLTTLKQALIAEAFEKVKAR